MCVGVVCVRMCGCSCALCVSSRGCLCAFVRARVNV